MEAAHMAPFDPCELLPEALPRVQRRGLGRQALQVEAWRRAMAQALLDAMTAVDRRAIPDQHHPAGHLPPQGLENHDDVGSIDGAGLAVAVPLPLRRAGADGGEMVAGAPLPQDGRLAYRRIGARDAGQGRTPGLV